MNGATQKNGLKEINAQSEKIVLLGEKKRENIKTKVVHSQITVEISRAISEESVDDCHYHLEHMKHYTVTYDMYHVDDDVMIAFDDERKHLMITSANYSAIINTLHHLKCQMYDEDGEC